MPEGEPATIRRGPRFELVVGSLDAAREALSAPLEDADLEAGWTESLCERLLARLDGVAELVGSGAAGAALLEAWSGGEDEEEPEELDELDAVDPEGDDARLDAILDVDLVLGDLDRAERALAATDELLASLGVAPSAEDLGQGFDGGVVEGLRPLAEDVRGTLAEGRTLSTAQMDRWADELRALGFRRRTKRPGVDDDLQLRGFNGEPIEQFRPGRRFEDLALYDGVLYSVALTDTLQEDEPGDDAHTAGGDDPATGDGAHAGGLDHDPGQAGA